MNPMIGLHLIIVDDASPWPAKKELQEIQIPPQITIDLFTRNNGGPAAARNSGLDRVVSETDFIAFIDSDDTWTGDHIERAISALGHSNDLYVAGNLTWEGLNNLDRTAFGAFIKKGQSPTLRPLGTVKDVWVCSNADIIPYTLKEPVFHTSSIVYRRSKFSTCRFDEELWYGEDNLFFLDLQFLSIRTCVSTQIEVILSLGENIYFRSLSWNSENNLKRYYHQFIKYKKINRRHRPSSQFNETVTQMIINYRPVLVFITMRQLLKCRRVPLKLLLFLLREDPQFITTFPVNILRAAAQWASGKIKGRPAFYQK
jgi:succinoglycan biosynthesis protein ExoW